MNTQSKFSDNGSAVSNVRLTPHLPKEFVSESYDQAFLSLIADLSAQLLLDAEALGNDKLEARIKSFDKFGLLQMTVPKIADFGPIEINVPGKGDEPDTKLVYNSEEPISYGFEKLIIEVDGERLSSDADYLMEISSIIAYMFAMKILPGTTDANQLVLLRLTQSVFAKFLDDYHQGFLNADFLTTLIVSVDIESMTENLDALSGFDDLAERLKVAAAESSERLSRELEEKLDRQVQAYKDEAGL